MADAPDHALHAAFDSWHAASAAHAAAYARVRDAGAAAAALAGDPALLALRHEAVTRAMFRRPSRTKRLAALSALALAGAPLAAFGIGHWMPSPAVERTITERFRTEVGQQATLDLPDGSRVTLDTASRIRIVFGPEERRVELEGQGWFQLAGSDKPFVIAANGREMRADAGRFDVRSDPGRLSVLALDGQMAVRPLGGSATLVTLGPSDMLLADDAGMAVRRPDDPARLTLWRKGLVQFDDVRLADAVDELNRYRRVPIRIADPRAAAVRISGSFRTAESPAFTDALAAGFPIRIRGGNDGVLIASR